MSGDVQPRKRNKDKKRRRGNFHETNDCSLFFSHVHHYHFQSRVHLKCCSPHNPYILHTYKKKTTTFESLSLIVQ